MEYWKHYYSSFLEENEVISVHKFSPSEMSSCKQRAEMYLNGGVYATTYRLLVLDLLTRKLPTSIITGFIINDCHMI